MSPAIFEMIVDPGEVKEREFKIINIKNEPVPVTATVKRLTPVEEEIDPALSQSFNAASWIEIPESNHILKGKERRDLTARVSVPKTAEPGGHYATIVLEPLVPTVTVDNKTAKVAAQVGIIVFITVKGEAVTEAAFSGHPDISSLQTKGEVPLKVAVANTGTIHVLPTATVEIRNIFGRSKASLPLKPRLVLPNTVKNFSTVWDDPGIFGIYSAEAEGTYGPGQTAINSGRKYFLVFRWLPFTAIALSLVAIIIFTLKTHRRWPAAYQAFKSKLPSRLRRVEEEDLL